jgi:hypothetical protein
VLASGTSSPEGRRRPDRRSRPGPSQLDPGSGGPDNDFTNRKTTFMTGKLLHLARMLKDAAASRPMATSGQNGTSTAASTSRTLSPADQPRASKLLVPVFRATSHELRGAFWNSSAFSSIADRCFFAC